MLAIGTGLGALGFLKRPKRLEDLMLPRFVIPALFWFVGFFPVIFYRFSELNYDQYEYDRSEYGGPALLYLIACLVFFWLGFLLPAKGRLLARTFRNRVLAEYPGRLRVLSILMVTSTFLYLIGAVGFSLFQEGWGGPLFEATATSYVLRQLILPLNILAVILFGLGWPGEKEGRGILHWLGAIYVLLLASAWMFSTFSRGAGIMPMLMVLGYFGRRKRIPRWTAVAAVCFAALAGEAGLGGRGIFGHNAGILPFFQQLFAGIDFSALADAGGVTTANDSFTQLCVVMRGVYTNVDMHAGTPLDWLAFQIPIPHIFGLFDVYTLDATEVVGGVGSWGYTASMFGDTFAHLSWFGCLPFMVMGYLYRVLEAISSSDESGGHVTNFAVLTLPISYFAFMSGSFNTFRAWNSTFVFGIGLCLLSLWTFNKWMPRQVNYGAQIDQPDK